MNLNNNNWKIEICEMSDEDVAARTKIRMSALRIHNTFDDHNDNGINWQEKYVSDNIKSFIGAPYKVAFIDDDKTIPSGHGNMEHNDRGEVIFPDSDTVGTILDAYIEDVEINGVSEKLVVTEGYLFYQSYSNFVDWLKEESNSNTIFGSVEINGKGKDKNIVYANESKNSDGTPYFGRQPKIFDFTALAILSSIVEPSDKSSQVLEVNSKTKEGEILAKNKSKNVELNELEYYDIATLITRAFNKLMCDPNNYYDYNYDIYRFYPQSGKVVFRKYCQIPDEYYMTTYTITNNSVTIGDIVKVEPTWTPTDNEQAVEINTDYIKEVLTKPKKKKEANKNMADENTMLELNQKLTDNAVEINNLTTKNTELETKNTELNSLITDANKTVEELNTKITNLEAELNTYKTQIEAINAEKAEAETEAKKVEVNTYFDTEIPKNGFTEEEVNSLKHYVDEVDISGLKTAESELCTKKFKEMLAKETDDNGDAEINSKKESLFITFPEKEKKVITDKLPTFFTE